MKIVHVVPALTKGGGERVAVELANNSVREGHTVTLIAGWSVDPMLLENEILPSVKVIHISSVSSSKIRRYVKMWTWLWRHRLWLAEQDILHCHLTYGAIFGTVVKVFRKNMSPLVVETYHAVGMPISRMRRKFHSFLALQRDALVLMAEDGFWVDFLGGLYVFV